MTICIGAIANLTGNDMPVIIACADKLRSTGIEFEHGVSKIGRIGEHLIMTSSDNTTYSDLIVEKIVRLPDIQNISIKDLVKKFSEECITFKKQKLENEVLFNYNLATESLKADPAKLVSETVNRLENYPYNQFQFIIAGFERFEDDENTPLPHLYLVDQDGTISTWDTIGYAVTGSGGNLAFTHLTKLIYTPAINTIDALIHVYYAKIASQRSVGVGKLTDIEFIFPKRTKDGLWEIITTPFGDQKIMGILNEGWQRIYDSETTILEDISNEIRHIAPPETPDEVSPSDSDEVRFSEPETETNPSKVQE
jgi:20S proteasome alpha/beta subunit